MTPRYEHNTPSCIFLGQFNNYDLYFYTDHYNINMKILIARYGPGGDYMTSPNFNIITAECIIEAHKRAAYAMLHVNLQRLI